MERERSALALARSWRWTGWLVGGLVLARVVAVIGLRPYLYVDSGEYAVVDFSGRWRRPWATPLLYDLLPGDHRWEVVGQAVVGGIAWSVLALVAGAWFRDRRVRVAVVGAIALLGLTTSVTNWDTAILSESLALSLTALLAAAWLELARRPTLIAAGAVLVATVPWLFVRQSLLPAAWLVVLAAVVAAAVALRHRARWRPLAAVAAGLLVLTLLATGSYGRNQEVVQTNLTVVVANRIATDPDRLAWFVDHGMPLPASGATDVGALTDDPAFSRWVAGDGRSTYARFLATHPWYTFTEPLDDLVGVRRSYGDPPAPKPVMLSPAEGYGSARAVIPEPIEQLLFDPGHTGTVLSVLGVVGAWSIVARRDRDRRWAVSLGLVAVSVASLVGGWHGATPELDRLAIVGAVALRLGLLLQLGLLVDATLARRATSPAPPVDGRGSLAA